MHSSTSDIGSAVTNAHNHMNGHHHQQENGGVALLASETSPLRQNGTSHTYGVEDSLVHSPEKNLPGGANWVVQKYGGTSVGKFAANIGDIVQASLQTSRIALVCSARSNSTKRDGTTNRLLRAADAARSPGSQDYYEIVDLIKQDHIQAAHAVIKSSAVVEAYTAQIKTECETLIKILESAQNLEEVSFKAENKIISKGEKLACMFMAAVLEDRGVPAQYVDLSDVIKNHNIEIKAASLHYQQLAIALGREIAACGDKVPVITGYFGHVPGGLLHSVGRGYTDLCAALVAVGIQAAELQVWKEVDGIFTADPRKVPTARLLSSVSPSEAAELTFYGSEVIHPFTMEQVIRARIPIRIKNVMNPRGSGTVIYPDVDEIDTSTVSRPTLFRSRSCVVSPPRIKSKRPTAVTIKHGIVVLNIHSNKRTRAHGFLANIFSILDQHHLSVDLISSSEVHVSMALHSDVPMLSGGGEHDFEIIDQDLRDAVEDLALLGDVDLAGDMAIISLVGKHLKKSTGVSGRFFSVLGENDINVEMISQGASEINISCVIWEQDADRALNVVHTNLFTFLE